MIVAIILTAGLSQRFGSPKALAQYQNQTIIEHVQKKLIAARVGQIIIVTGYNSKTINPYIFKHRNIKTVYNKDYKFGQTISFKKGVQSLPDSATGIALFPVDVPFFQTETVNQLVDAFWRYQPDILIPTFHNQKGHPPIFSMALKKDILALKNDAGINVLTRSDRYHILRQEVEDSGIRASFNTAQEWQALLKRYPET